MHHCLSLTWSLPRVSFSCKDFRTSVIELLYSPVQSIKESETWFYHLSQVWTTQLHLINYVSFTPFCCMEHSSVSRARSPEWHLQDAIRVEKKTLQFLFIYVWSFKILFFIYVYSCTPLTSVIPSHRTHIPWLSFCSYWPSSSQYYFHFHQFLCFSSLYLALLLPRKTPAVDKPSLLPSSCLPPGCLGQLEKKIT